MAAIGIATLPQAGHINPTLHLRKELLAAGHHVTYIVRPGEEAYYAERDLPYDLLEMRPNGALLSFRPDVVLVEAVLVDLAIIAFEFYVPTLKISATFSQRYEPSLPPPTTDLFPDASERGAARIAEAWRVEHDKLQADPWYRCAAGWAREHGFPFEWVDDRAAMGVTFRLPELTLAPAELDFERAGDDLFYAGPCVDLARDETGRAPLSELRSDQPLVYCCFGTQVHRYPSLPERIRLVIEAARLLPRVTFVISWDGDGFEELPANVVVMRNAPQLALLRRSALTLTHGGLNSVKEALCLGVPPIVLPFDRDQPGNAARVEYHGYGRKADWETTSAGDLAGLVSCTLEDEGLRQRVRALGEKLAKAIDEQHAVKAFERCWERSLQFMRPIAPEHAAAADRGVGGAATVQGVTS